MLPAEACCCTLPNGAAAAEVKFAGLAVVGVHVGLDRPSAAVIAALTSAVARRQTCRACHSHATLAHRALPRRLHVSHNSVSSWTEHVHAAAPKECGKGVKPFAAAGRHQAEHITKALIGIGDAVAFTITEDTTCHPCKPVCQLQRNEGQP